MRNLDGTVSRGDNLPFNHFTHTMEVAMSEGVDVWPHLHASNLASEVLAGDFQELSRIRYFHFISLLLDNAELPAFGMQIGPKLATADYGVLGYAFISSPTLGHALRTFLRFQ